MGARAAALLCWLFFFSAGARACSCWVSSPACGALQPDGILFLGEVTAYRTVQVPLHLPRRSNLFTSNRVFRIRVLESFSGVQRAGDEVEVRTGNGGGDCGYDFVVGRRYLVDAYPSQPEQQDGLNGVELGTGICSHTREEGEAGVALRELRTALSHGRQPDLSGSVRYLKDGHATAGEPLPALQVTLTAKVDGAVYRTVTDADGIYTFATLPPGSYTAAVDLPPHRQLLLNGEERPLDVALPANDGTGLACHLNAQVGATGGIRVRVVDAAGKAQPGVVMLSVAGEQADQGRYGSEMSENGDYLLAQLPDGRYQLNFINYETHMRGIGTAVVKDGEVSDAAVIMASPFSLPSEEKD